MMLVLGVVFAPVLDSMVLGGDSMTWKVKAY